MWGKSSGIYSCVFIRNVSSVSIISQDLAQLTDRLTLHDLVYYICIFNCVKVSMQALGRKIEEIVN